MFDKPYLVTGLLLALAAATTAVAIASHFAFFVVPLAWTQEPGRLVDALGVRPGDRVADIGAGDGSHAVAVAKMLGERGEVLATDLDPERRRAIAETAARAQATNVRIVEAAADATNLPDRCCRAIYMRTMLHHVTDRAAFARDVVRSVEPGGRIAVIDFAPGHLWFHGHDHGVAPRMWFRRSPPRVARCVSETIAGVDQRFCWSSSARRMCAARVFADTGES